MTRGFGLIELAVALTIFSFGILALVGAAAFAHRTFVTSHALEAGTAAAATVLDSLMRVPSPAGGERRMEHALVSWTVRTADATTHIAVVLQFHDGTRTRVLAFHAVHSGAALP